MEQQDPRDRLTGPARLAERIGFAEGIAVLVLAAVACLVIGLATHQVWLTVVGAILFVLVIVDAIVLSWLRRRTRRP